MTQAENGIAFVEDTIATRLDRACADRLASLPQPSPEAYAIQERVVDAIGSITFREPHPLSVFGWVADVALAEDPDAMETELPDATDEGGRQTAGAPPSTCCSRAARRQGTSVGGPCGLFQE